MDDKIVKLGDDLMKLSTAEAIELQNYLESKGLKPVQPTVIAAPVEVKEEVVESANVNIRLLQTGGLIKLAKAIMPKTGVNASKVKEFTLNMPAVIMENIPRAEASAILSEWANDLDPKEFVFELQDC